MNEFFQKAIDLIQIYWPMFLRGAWTTLYISIIGTVSGFIIGLLMGIIRTIPGSKKKGSIKGFLLKIINFLISAYVEIFRGTPMIVQAMVIYYGIPIVTGYQLDKFAAAMFIVAVNTGAYMSEIVRGGIVSIDKGQFEAAHAIGMNHVQTMVHVVLPQVIRNILPATGNEFVINIKDTSVLNVIAVTELFYNTNSIASSNYLYFQAFLIASVIYFVMTFTITRILRFIERKIDGPSNYVILDNQKPSVKGEVMGSGHNQVSLPKKGGTK
ncbi:amino acid ABC transporter membrane protein (PAAT family) [Mobilisporobacter senegalensis]|uniref:Amino acid ABC transporter membrane protein (PAAT family) n=1 Tax=Mobilisporobacter senegalensis TaxID=1329262 RepID=A0A3N1XGA0_9FIRM|nr:amino acid ABC transporter permease [Mobilisporobacter senegalensis]ROR25734.1 amino acid ABC transporter membrane protein (PAAT family) [Mobilisporobacter senegalensis]